MEITNNGNRFYNYYKWENVKNNPYDYERFGLLKHIMSKSIVNSKNPILQSVLMYYEKSLVFIMKQIDKLKQFKNYHYYNR